ncbi:redoxin domain-containing protein [Armatimonas sp.]|uniref:redoxin domain-containing protein n=1 Tax=Armatimonas sp. TaxID=1872638 RepID=UPI00286A56EA|nr:redoxin domain-containing protein [Armatimonas sp.]
MKRCILSCFALLGISGVTALAHAQEPVKPAFGHSMQGEAFNEGPRQRAVLLKGIPKIEFPTSTKNKKAQQFFEQGVAQIHAYWYFEAERSFRQAADLDPELAMAYWGMARANANNRTRAKGFAEKAKEKRDKASKREQGYIDAISFFANNKNDDYIKALRQLVADYPLDIEATAQLAHELQERAFDKPRQDEVERLTQEVLASYPMHPIHHYRIHLWDKPNNENALDSAHKSGLTEQASAHMWHMEGHIYTQLKRYGDAAVSQEASARVDHAHMGRVQIIPDQIFNYAHNNQWLAESFEFTGQPQKALEVARNLVANPRHPKLNTLSGFSGSASQGLPRLIETLERYELWETALTENIESIPNKADHERNRLRLLGCAAYAMGKRALGQQHLDALGKIKDSDKAIAAVKCYAALGENNSAEASKQLDAAGLPKEREALLRLQLGEPEKALTLARDAAKSRANQVLPQAALVRVLHASGKLDETKAELEKLRPLAARAELDTPLLAALAPIAQQCGASADWRGAPPADPLALPRPKIESLGPLSWVAPAAPSFSLKDGNGKKVSLKDYAGKPVIVLFFLGASCEKCMEQVNAFAAEAEGYRKAGIELVAISLDPQEQVKKMKAMPFPILANPDLKTFKSWKAFDDFEDMALHGTFLVDGTGKLRWMDTGFAPFTDAKFVLTEAQRLLSRGR